VTPTTKEKRSAPRRLSDAKGRILTPDEQYSIDAYRLTAAVREAAGGGAFTSFFVSPRNFLRTFNSGSAVVKSDKPMSISNSQLTKIDPLLLLKAAGVSMQPSGISHSFPFLDSSQHGRAIRRIASKLTANAKNTAALRAMLRDPHLLLYLREHYYPTDTASFISLCRFVFPPTLSSPSVGLGALHEASFLASVDYLREMMSADS